MDILDRLRARTQPATHWETCADYHDLCAAIEEIERLREENRVLRERNAHAGCLHWNAQGEGCPICQTDERCRTRAVLEGE